MQILCPGVWRATYMNMTAAHATRISALCAAIGIALSGCTAAPPAAPVAPEQAVTQRANARWQALVAGDIEQAYGFLAPSYRAVTPLERYRSGIGGAATWVGAQVVRVKCATEKCTAVVKIEAKPILAKPYKGSIATAVDETWLLEDGQWWLYQKL